MNMHPFSLKTIYAIWFFIDLYFSRYFFSLIQFSIYLLSILFLNHPNAFDFLTIFVLYCNLSDDINKFMI